MLPRGTFRCEYKTEINWNSFFFAPIWKGISSGSSEAEADKNEGKLRKKNPLKLFEES